MTGNFASIQESRRNMANLRDVFVHPLALVESDDIGVRTRVWPFAHVMRDAHIGSDCNIGEHAFIESEVRLGNNVTVKNGVAIWTGVEIEDNVFLGPNCVFTNDLNPRAYIKKPRTALIPTHVRSNVTVGANATILCGINLGRFAFVGAGAVVVKSVPDFALVVGNPARHIGWMCVCGRKLSLAASAVVGRDCTCTECKRSFSRSGNGLSES